MNEPSPASPFDPPAVRLTLEFTGLAKTLAGPAPLPMELPRGTSYREIVGQLAGRFPQLVGIVIAADRQNLLNANVFSRNGGEVIMPDQLDRCPEDGDRLVVITIIVGGAAGGAPPQALRVARLDPRAKLPTRKHPEDAGLDLYSLDPARIPPNGAAILRTGVTVAIPAGTAGLLKPKGRSDHLLGAGVIDAGYQGEILVKVVNPLDRPLEFAAGEAIAQLLLVPVLTPQVIEVAAGEIHSQASGRGATGGIVDQRAGSDRQP